MQRQRFFPPNERYASWGSVLVFMTAMLVGILGIRHAAQAQTFNSGSTGADGPLNLTTPGTIIFDPSAFTPPLDPDGDNVFHFTTINIGAGVTVRLLATHLNGPVFWLASGAVQISGTLDLSGGDGHDHTIFPANRTPSVPGAGGYPGGVGGDQAVPAQPGSGPQGGAAGTLVVPPASASRNMSNSFLVPLLGGSGGGGVRINALRYGTGGGAGGGGNTHCKFRRDLHQRYDPG